jgi:hypothetical protein
MFVINVQSELWLFPEALQLCEVAGFPLFVPQLLESVQVLVC